MPMLQQAQQTQPAQPTQLPPAQDTTGMSLEELGAQVQQTSPQKPGPSAVREEPRQADETAVSPELQAEYERATEAMSQVIYGTSKKTSDAIADSIIAEDKVGSLISTAVNLVSTVDKQIDMDEEVMFDVMEDTVLMLAEVAEAKNGVSFDQDDIEAAQMGAGEGLMFMLGGDDGEIAPDYKMATEGLTPQDMQTVQQEYTARFDKAKGRQQDDQKSVLKNPGVDQLMNMGGQNG